MFPVDSGFSLPKAFIDADNLSSKPTETNTTQVIEAPSAALFPVGAAVTNHFESAATYYKTHGMLTEDNQNAVLAFLYQASKTATSHQVELFLSERHNGQNLISQILNAFELNARLVLSAGIAGSKRARNDETDIETKTIWISQDKWIDQLLARSDLGSITKLKVIYQIFKFLAREGAYHSLIINESALLDKLSNFMTEAMSLHCPEISLSEVFGENLRTSLSSTQKKICFEFARYLTDNDLFMMLSMVSSPIQYYNSNDILQQLIDEEESGDEPCSWIELSKDYIKYPALYDPFFEAILTTPYIDYDYVLNGFFQLGLLLPLDSSVSSQARYKADVFYQFIKEGNSKNCLISIKQMLMLSTMDHHAAIGKHLIAILGTKIYYNFNSKQVSFLEGEGSCLTVFDYLQLKEGTQLISLMSNIEFKLLSDRVCSDQVERLLTHHLVTCTELKRGLIIKKSLYTHLFPLFLMYLEHPEKVDFHVYANTIFQSTEQKVFEILSFDILNRFSGDPSINSIAFEIINKVQQDFFDFLITHYFDAFVALSYKIIDDSTVNFYLCNQVVSLFMLVDPKKTQHAAYLSKIKEHFNQSWIKALTKRTAFTSMEALVVKEFEVLSYFLIDKQNFDNFSDEKQKSKIALYLIFKEKFPELSFASSWFIVDQLFLLNNAFLDRFIESYQRILPSLSSYFSNELVRQISEFIQDVLIKSDPFSREMFEKFESLAISGPRDDRMIFIIQNFPRLFSNCFHNYMLIKKNHQFCLTSKLFNIPKSLYYSLKVDEEIAFKEKGDIEQKLNRLLTQLEIDLSKNLSKISTENQDWFRELIYVIIHLPESSIGNRLKQHIYSHFAVKVTDPDVDVKLFRMLEENFSLQNAPLHVDITGFRKQFIYEIRKIFGSIDLLNLGQLIQYTSEIQYLSDGEPLNPAALQLYKSQIKDDEDHLVPPEHILKAMKTLIDTVLSRRTALAVPKESHEKRTYFDLLELKLKKALELIQEKMSQKKSLPAVAAILSRIALSRDHCATRWMDEATAAISELDSEHSDSTAAQKTLQQLYAERVAVMQELTLHVFPEAGPVGPIHYFSAVQTIISTSFGLENPHEGFLSHEQFEEVKQRLIAVNFIQKIKKEYIRRVWNLLSAQSIDLDQKKGLEEEVLSFISKGYSLKFLSMPFSSPIGLQSRPIFNEIMASFSQFKDLRELSPNLASQLKSVECFLATMEDAELKSELIFKDILPISYFKKIIPFFLAHPVTSELRGELLCPNLVSPNKTETNMKAFFTSHGKTLDEMDLKFIGLCLENQEVRMAIIESKSEAELLRVFVNSRILDTLRVYFNYYTRTVLKLPHLKLIQARADNNEMAIEYTSTPAILDAFISALIDPAKNESLIQTMHEHLKKKWLKLKIHEQLRVAGFTAVTGNDILVLISRFLNLLPTDFTITLEDFLKRIIETQNRSLIYEGHLDKLFEQYPHLYKFFRQLYLRSLGFIVDIQDQAGCIPTLLKLHDDLIDAAAV